MDPTSLLGLALGTSFAAGLNLYATVLTAGLLGRYGVVDLPTSLDVLQNPVVLGVAALLFAVEFVADKVPWVDSLWDAIHTVVRPLAAAVLGVAGFADLGQAWQVAAALLAGGVALTSHSAKASTRAAVNASPEPFTNWTLSLVEDGLAVGLTWLAVTHPLITAGLVTVLLIAAWLVIRSLFRFVRQRFRRKAEA